MKHRAAACLALALSGCASSDPRAEPTAISAASPGSAAEAALDAQPLDEILYPPPIARPDERAARFGTIVTDEAGRRRVVPAREIPNIDHQSFGWVIWVGESKRPVTWVETLRAPRDGVWKPGGAQRIVEIDASGHALTRVVSVSPDGRTRTTRGEGTPVAGFLHHASTVQPGTPSGAFALSVSLPDGRTQDFDFVLGEPQGACPFSQMSLQWWQDAGDPAVAKLSEHVLLLFGGRLVYHGFLPVDDVNQAHWVVDAIAMPGASGIETAGHVSMRAVADFLGGVMRYDLTTPGATRDYGVLFSKPSYEIDAYLRELADEFAAKLSPYARQLCADWSSGRHGEEANLERIRQGLVEEIQRIRRERMEKQRKRLELGIE